MIKIRPWISENYKDGAVKYGRILLLGESHYGNSTEFDSDFTNEVIKDVIDGTVCNGYRYYTMLGRIFNPNDRSDIFENCAFANLIQEILEKPRIHPSSSELSTIRDSFWEILKLTKPSKVIVTSVRAWNNWLPDDDPRGKKVSDISIGGKHSTVWKYKFEDVSCEAIGIGHPSGKNFYSWEGVVKAFISKSATNIN